MNLHQDSHLRHDFNPDGVNYGISPVINKFLNRIENTPLRTLERYNRMYLTPNDSKGKINYFLSIVNPKRVIKSTIVKSHIELEKISLETKLIE